MLFLALEMLKLVLKTPLALHEAAILRLAEDNPLFVEGRLQVLVALLREGRVIRVCGSACNGRQGALCNMTVQSGRNEGKT